jgi:FkbM family methyltransferase
MRHSTVTLRRRARCAVRHLGIEIHRYQRALDVDVRRTRFLSEQRVGAIVDGGANRGQWAQAVRGNGYRGVIVSFEPLTDAFAALSIASAGDPLWRCVQAALGEADAEAQLNVAGNSFSSSLLPMELTHTSASPESVYVRTEAVHVVRLDSVVPEMVLAGTNLALKLDLQGYEAAALAGAEGILAEVRLVECELSIVPLYHGQSLYRDMIELLEGLGFSLASLSEGLVDPGGHVMQVDAIFVRAPSR